MFPSPFGEVVCCDPAKRIHTHDLQRFPSPFGEVVCCDCSANKPRPQEFRFRPLSGKWFVVTAGASNLDTEAVSRPDCADLKS